jgi:hypothetical protein
MVVNDEFGKYENGCGLFKSTLTAFIWRDLRIQQIFSVAVIGGPASRDCAACKSRNLAVTT